VVDHALFIEALRREFPVLVPHLEDETTRGLLHVEMGCFARFTQQAIDDGDREAVAQSFQLAHHLFHDGDEAVKNAVAVSYLEYLNFADGRQNRAWARELLSALLASELRAIETFWNGESRKP
jgi:hypothetical protein